MGFFDSHHFYHPDRETAERLVRVEDLLSDIQNDQERIMIDTKKIIEAVARANTRAESLIALVKGQGSTMKSLSAQLAEAIANNDPIALAQVQADLDKGADDLNVESVTVEAAINENTPEVAPAPAPAPDAGPVA